jgi:carbohydrate diacid regulator
MKGMYSEETNDFVTSVDEGHIVLVKTLEEDTYEEVETIAKTIVDMVGAEAMVDSRVSYGTIVNELKDISKSYKEANMALDVGRIFYVERNILAYNGLGIGRLIHQLPISLCEMFLNEVFKGNAVEQFDEDTLMIVNAFFENNLNISETARQMYLHRNTLGYRLEKIVKTTGLDVRKFDDALTFKIALMVSDHMKFIKTQE